MLLLSLAFKIWKEIRLPQKLKHLNIGNKFSLENSQVAINLHSSDINLGNFELVKRNIIVVKFLATLNETSPQGFRKECKMLESQDFFKKIKYKINFCKLSSVEHLNPGFIMTKIWAFYFCKAFCGSIENHHSTTSIT